MITDKNATTATLGWLCISDSRPMIQWNAPQHTRFWQFFWKQNQWYNDDDNNNSNNDNDNNIYNNNNNNNNNNNVTYDDDYNDGDDGCDCGCGGGDGESLRRQTTMPVICRQCFLKRLYQLHIWYIFIFFISTQVEQSSKDTDYDHLNHNFTALAMSFHFEVEGSFFTFLFSTRKRLIRFHFFIFARCLVECLSKTVHPNFRYFLYFSRYSTFVSCSSQYLAKK